MKTMIRDETEELVYLTHHREELRNHVAVQCHKQPKRIALVDSRRTITYEALTQLIDDIETSLRASGITKGDRVVTIIPNSIEFAALLYACARIGAVLAPLNVLLEQREVEQRLAILDPKMVFSSTLLHTAVAQQKGCDTISLNHTSGGETFDSFLHRTVLREQARSGYLTDDDPLLIIFTSGSTGDPKGVVLSSKNLLHAIEAMLIALQCSKKDVFLAGLPICHLFGINTGILLPLYVGATSVLMDCFKADAALDLIEDRRITIFNGVPAMFKRMIQCQLRNRRDVSSMRCGLVGGAECTNLVEYLSVLNCDARVIYGLTESPVLTTTRVSAVFDASDPSVGTPVRDVEARIIDDDGKLLDAGEIGELICRSPGTMMGYYRDPEGTRRLIDGQGWLHTGDYAFFNEEGCVCIAGRKSDVINRGGYKIYPAEVESVYHQHPAVVDVCVMGLPHQELGEQTVAFVEAHSSQVVDANDLREYCKGKLAKYKIPDQVLVLERLPHLANNKHDKQEMRKLFGSRSDVFHNDAGLHQVL